MGRPKIKPYIEKTCEFCNNNFTTDLKERKFCSRDCYFKTIAKPDLFCTYCGNKIDKYKHYNEYKTLFCDKQCQGNYLRTPFNEHFFEDETPEVAYWAGFLMADGSTRKRKWCNTSLRLTLAMQDKGHLEKFCDSIGLDKDRIKTINRKNKEFIKENNKKYIRQQEVYIEIVSPYLLDSIKKWGIVPNKTYVGCFPNINPQLYKSYIRGLIDGDGSIWFNKYKTGTGKGIFLCGSENIIHHVAKILEDELGLNIILKHRKPHKKTGYVLWTFTVATWKDVETLGNWLYNEPDFILDRKYAKWLLIKERFYNKHEI